MNGHLDLKNFKEEFAEFCSNDNSNSGKPNSYALAIVYLIEYLNFDRFDSDVFLAILAKEDDIRSKDSAFYQLFLNHLAAAGHKSYLDNGYVSAAIPFLKNFYESMDVHKERFQKIFFGAPGTGKSHKIDYNLFKDKNGNSTGTGLKSIPKDKIFRTTFHPDYDYAQFVGAYKPVKKIDLGKNLTIENLSQHAKSFESGDFPLYKFSALYSDSLQNLDIHEKMEVVKESPLGVKKDGTIKDQTTFSMEMNAGVAVGNYLKKTFASSVTYEFVPQIFAKAYVAAWKNYLADNEKPQPVYLVIEEINRGNCAQIFGDIFQLLDRDEKGFSRFEIDADADFAEWLKENGLSAKLMLPPNFNILATMNTSDQSLFPMDSAFKRRFDWEYVPINYEHPDADFTIDLGNGNKKTKWLAFIKKANEEIFRITLSEDKQLGEFFIKPNESGNVISRDRFLGKVMFYLWNEVCKDEHNGESFFKVATEKDSVRYFTFQDFYKEDDLLDKFMEKFMKPVESQG